MEICPSFICLHRPTFLSCLLGPGIGRHSSYPWLVCCARYSTPTRDCCTCLYAADLCRVTLKLHLQMLNAVKGVPHMLSCMKGNVVAIQSISSPNNDILVLQTQPKLEPKILCLPLPPDRHRSSKSWALVACRALKRWSFPLLRYKSRTEISASSARRFCFTSSSGPSRSAVRR